MKSRLSSTIWTLVLANGVVLFAVLGLAYSAGRQSGGASLFDFGALPSGASGSVLLALALAIGMALAPGLAPRQRSVRPRSSSSPISPSASPQATFAPARTFTRKTNSATSPTILIAPSQKFRKPTATRKPTTTSSAASPSC